MNNEMHDTIASILENMNDTRTRLKGIVDDLSTSSGNHTTICISGGLNGHGVWSDYLVTLSKVMREIEMVYPDSFIEKIENDTLDDVFYAYIGIIE